MSTPVLGQIVELIEENPHSAAALTLYALVSTMEYDGAGCLFKLNKLSDLSPDQRQLAYQLMELMVAGAPESDEWKRAKVKMDTAVRQG